MFHGEDFEHIPDDVSDDKEAEAEIEQEEDISPDHFDDKSDPVVEVDYVEEQAEEVETTTDFLTAIQAALSFLTGDKKSGKAMVIAKSVGPLITLACGIFTLIRGIINGVWKWYEYVIHITSLVSTMCTIYAIFWDFANRTNVAKVLLKLAMSSFSNITCAGGAVYSLVMKVVTVFGAGTLLASGFGGTITKFGGIISAVKQTGDFMTDVINNLGHLFGFDLTDRSDLNKAIIARTRKLHEYLTMPTSAWSGDLYAEIEGYSQDCRQMVQTNRGIGDTVTLQGLMKLINDVDDRLRSIKEEWACRKRRPVPVGLYLWSARGGLGKTEFVRRLALLLSKCIEGYNSRIYSIQPAATHFARYYGEHTMHFDEVGAVRNTDEKTSPFTQLNNIISANTVPMPSASLGGKNQIPQPHVVVMTSNRDMDEIDTKLSDEAHNALRSRMLVYDFCDDSYDPRRSDARQNQPHRKPGFSHIRFRTRHKELNVDDLVKEVCNRIGKSLDNFSVLNSAEVGEEPFVYKGKPLSVDKNCGADDTKYLHWFSGLPGSGKSHAITPHVKDLAKHASVNLHIPGTLAELQAIKPKISDVFLIDDLFDITCETQQLLFIQWYNSLPVMCKIIVVSNYGPNSINPFSMVYKLKKLYKPIDNFLMKPALPRRIGFVKSDEARFLVRHDGGWTDLDGKEFELDDILADWLKSDSGAAYPTVLDRLPNPLPVTAKEADVWYETDAEKLTFRMITMGIFRSASFRAAKYMAQMKLLSFDITSIGATVTRMAYQLTKSIEDPKVYVRVGPMTWYYYKGEVYAGGENSPATVVLA